MTPEEERFIEKRAKRKHAMKMLRFGIIVGAFFLPALLLSLEVVEGATLKVCFLVMIIAMFMFMGELSPKIDRGENLIALLPVARRKRTCEHDHPLVSQKNGLIVDKMVVTDEGLLHRYKVRYLDGSGRKKRATLKANEVVRDPSLHEPRMRVTETFLLRPSGRMTVESELTERVLALPVDWVLPNERRSNDDR